jgi:hypothetical protein
MHITPLTSVTAATQILAWMQTASRLTLPIDLNYVRQMLPDTPFGRGAVIMEPADLNWNASEGALVRNPDDEREWGIFVNPKAHKERRRFTIAHELGHFVLHRAMQLSFLCDKESVYAGLPTLKRMEREADDFASNLLMPRDLLRERIEGVHIDFHLLSRLATEFGVSLESMCIRFIKYTDQRAVLVHWDHGFMKYHWRSNSAARTGVRLHQTDSPQEPFGGTLAADEGVEQEWDGVDVHAGIWCSSTAGKGKLRELKHSYAGGNRVLSLLMLK